jgi:membrane associated rhomboid family serine protease
MVRNIGPSASRRGDVADREPIFNIPGGVLATLAVLVAVHVTLSSMAPEQYTWWLLALAFIPARYAGLAAELPGGEPALFTSFITHMAVHADVIHLGFNAAWMLAFGSVLCSRIGNLRFFAFSITGGIAGALFFLGLNPGLAAPVIGASGAISTMMGGVTRFLFNAIDSHQGYLLRENPAAIPRISLIGALKDKRIVLFSIVFIGLNLLAIIGFGKFGATGSIAWEAHVGGYLFGLFAFGIFDIAAQEDATNFIERD